MTITLRIATAASLLVLAACSQAPAEAPAVTEGAWTVDSDASQLSYVTIKQGEILETNAFDTLTGSVAADGAARIEIDLASVDTGIDIRNERMREVFFDVANNPTATVTAALDPAAFANLAVGESTIQPVAATLSLRGLESELETELQVSRIAADRVSASTTAPIIVEARDFELGAGLDQLRELAGLDAITPAVPVTFSITFERQ